MKTSTIVVTIIALQQAYLVNTFFRGMAMDNYPCKMENLRVCIIKILYIELIRKINHLFLEYGSTVLKLDPKRVRM